MPKVRDALLLEMAPREGTDHGWQTVGSVHLRAVPPISATRSWRLGVGPFGHSRAVVAEWEGAPVLVGLYFDPSDEPSVDDASGAERTLLDTLWMRRPDPARRLRLWLHGTPLQLAVWQALSAIPAGETRSYSEVAQMAGYPRAIRAAASAVGSNPVSWMIPCHRVIRSDGSLGGYHWGLAMKRAMLACEGLAIDHRS